MSAISLGRRSVPKGARDIAPDHLEQSQWNAVVPSQGGFHEFQCHRARECQSSCSRRIALFDYCISVSEQPSNRNGPKVMLEYIVICFVTSDALGNRSRLCVQARSGEKFIKVLKFSAVLRPSDPKLIVL